MSESDNKALETITRSSLHFGQKLYKILRENPGNVFFSPTSLEVVLAVAHMGAGGKTAEEIRTGLELPSDVNIIKNGYHAIMNSLKSTNDMTLEIANKVFTERTFPVEQEFYLVAEKHFLAAAENVDFLGNPEASRLTVNSWVEKQTRDKIKNLLAEGDVECDTKMVLVNAVYFKGKWLLPFNPSDTYKETFFLTPSETKEVDMMHIKKKFGYLELNELQAKMLVMPYMGGTMSMIILLPYEINGIQEMEAKLHSFNIGELVRKVNYLEVEVSLPRFKIEVTMDLGEALKKLGMTSMFDPNMADFSGISKEKGLYVSKVVQKAFIEVNEEGSEAAAATGMIVTMRMMLPNLQFIANHPFYFTLTSASGINLFEGKIVDPPVATTA